MSGRYCENPTKEDFQAIFGPAGSHGWGRRDLDYRKVYDGHTPEASRERLGLSTSEIDSFEVQRAFRDMNLRGSNGFRETGVTDRREAGVGDLSHRRNFPVGVYDRRNTGVSPHDLGRYGLESIEEERQNAWCRSERVNVRKNTEVPCRWSGCHGRDPTQQDGANATRQAAGSRLLGTSRQVHENDDKRLGLMAEHNRCVGGGGAYRGDVTDRSTYRKTPENGAACRLIQRPQPPGESITRGSIGQNTTERNRVTRAQQVRELAAHAVSPRKHIHPER